MTGVLRNGAAVWEARNHVPSFATKLNDYAHGSHHLPSITSAATTLLAKTSPGRAYVSLPLAVGELKDLPGQLKNYMFLFSKSKPPPKITGSSPGSAYLEWKFGWAPLLQDLGALLTAQEAIDKRVDELHKLYEEGGVKRRLKLGESGSAENVSPLFDTTIHNWVIRYNGFGQTVGEQWGTVRWVPTLLPKRLTPPVTRKLAHDAVLGLSGNHISDVWNLIPWSWLIDWAVNIDSFLKATNNAIPCQPVDVCIMRHLTTKTRWVYQQVAGGTMSGGTGTTTLETKERFANVGPGLTASIPFLNGGQLSILGSLLSSHHRAGRF